MGGAQNHGPLEGDYRARARFAVQAFHEWMPTRTPAADQPGYIGPRIWRGFQFGDLASLSMLETRLARGVGEACGEAGRQGDEGPGSSGG